MAKKKVLVAMSGGVDSSVTAALLLQQGFDVFGVTMQIWDPAITEVNEEHVGCCSYKAVEDARQVAAVMDIPFFVMNFREVFEEKVVKNFVSEYSCGRTPNPCIVCNRYVKFESLLNKGMGLGADYIATGHYARVGYSEQLGRYTLSRGVDQKKDQTYVLYNLTQEQISKVLMPLGDYTKEQVRRMAAELALPVADKSDSQEICFVPDDDYRGFLQGRISNIEPGDFINLQGEVIGRHQGIPFYTVGQRRGLGLAAGHRLFVIKMDGAANTITLGPEEAVWGRRLVGTDANWILFDKLQEKMQVEAQVRYNGKPAAAVIVPLPGGDVEVCFDQPQRSISPGQAVVFYQGDCILGGATIVFEVRG